ncbi:helix-turn-helix domain-containing protein [Sinanaerobacter chloroacetimidivorans]|uniref:Helix-turn-helix domain-containing protein n=1 Tax=Sinanaerobacter chloroacetimidivorans TaxID=2818044 RepID=A0A8J7W064_9FIRM|nr:helix-turn-helix domain-containing protein [Sinanaerobacter chloroacetimidivorans]MBR0597934.1 helix-turn-helix domain-containing protein [Sinanaerobacter chloroacetimidivorans]
MHEEILYTPEELANKLKLSKYTIYEMIKRGDIQAHRIGRSIRVSQSQLELYIMSTRKTDNVYDAEIIREGNEKYALIKDVKINVSTEFDGRVKISVRPEDIILSKNPLVSSARNVMKGTVTDLIFDEKSAKVFLNVGIPMLIFITRQSMLEMNINKGDELYAIFKTMAVKVIK